MKQEELIPTHDAALAAGRFIMEVPGKNEQDIYGRPVARISFENLISLGLFEFSDLYVSRGEGFRAISAKRLETACEKNEYGWVLQESFHKSKTFWDAFIKSDSPFLFVYRSYTDALSELVANLTNVAVFADHGNSLSDELLQNM